MTLELTFTEGSLLLGPPGLPDEHVPPGFVVDRRAGGRYRALAFVYREAIEYWRRLGVAVDDRARAYEVLDLRFKGDRKPYPHQQNALDAWQAAKGRGLVVLPTGAGKTHVAELAIMAVRRSTLIVVPTIDLMVQWRAGLGTAFGAAVGMIGGGTFEVKPITITTYDSAYLHMARLGDKFGLVIFDEAHHLPSPSYAQAAELCLAPYRLGLTATPERADGQHVLLDGLIGPEVFRLGVSDLSGEYLAEYDFCVIPVELSPDERADYDASRQTYLDFIRKSGIRMGSAGGFRDFIRVSARSPEGRRAFRAYRHQKQLTELSASKVNVLAQLFRDHQDAKILFFTNENRALFDLARKFLVPVIAHTTPAAERLHILQGLASGLYRIVGASHVLNEGVDMPDVSVGVVLSGSGSVRAHVQRLGRLLRRRGDKVAVLYEIVSARTVEEFTSDRRRAHEAYGGGE
jgi:superfamily II DNA or RNA helicase